MYGFGTGKRASGSKLSLVTPGPGTYLAKTFTGFDLPQYSMGQTLSFEPHRKEQKQKPGPGTYSPQHDQTNEKRAAWKIGSDIRRDLKFDKCKEFQTAPGQYDPDPTKVQKKAAGWRIGSESRPGLVTKGHDKYPGAGTYELPSHITEGPKVHMHAKTDLANQNKKKD